MSDRKMSKIEWTERTWNPTRGCSRVSEGCRNCYAERQAIRMAHGPGLVAGNGAGGGMRQSKGGAYQGLVTNTGKGPRWTGKVQLVPEKLDEPLRKRKPTTWFVDSMSDLFHEEIPGDYIAAVFGVMAATPHHTYQILTKRPERARAWFAAERDLVHSTCAWLDRAGRQRGCGSAFIPDEWPLDNIWFGVSVEDQTTADERIPQLLQCPAAVRFVSYEPALGPVEFRPRWMPRHAVNEHGDCADWCRACGPTEPRPRVDWIIVGGESGPGARPFDIEWARSTIRQCRDAGVACFIKQLGRYPFGPVSEMCLDDSKGGDWEEWPDDLRVREWPHG